MTAVIAALMAFCITFCALLTLFGVVLLWNIYRGNI